MRRCRYFIDDFALEDDFSVARGNVAVFCLQVVGDSSVEVGGEVAQVALVFQFVAVLTADVSL